MRERDNLPNGDIDRTHRQQAIIDYVIWKLGHEGVLSDLGQLTTLLGVAKKYVITDPGWQIVQLRQRDEEPDRKEPDLPDGAATSPPTVT